MTVKAVVKSPFTPEQEKTLKAWTTHYPYPIMGVLEALRSVQGWHLCVTPDDEAYVAEVFATTRARVHELVTFFPMFTETPTGRKRIGVCHGLSCAIAGAGEVCKNLEARLHVAEGETTKDGEFSFEELECIGACDHAPAFQVNDELRGRATQAKLDEVLKR